MDLNAHHHSTDRAPRGSDRLLYDAAFGVVWPRVGEGAVTAAWAVLLGLLAVALLVGGLAFSTVPQIPLAAGP